MHYLSIFAFIYLKFFFYTQNLGKKLQIILYILFIYAVYIYHLYVLFIYSNLLTITIKYLLIIYSIKYNKYSIYILRLTQRASETMASAALALFALRLIMTAAVAIEAMIEIIREQMIRIARGEAELDATHYVLGPVVLTVPFSRAADLPLSHSVHFSAPTIAL